MVCGTGPEARQLLDAMESGAHGLARASKVRDGAKLERVYRIDAPSREAAIGRISEALGIHAASFDIG